MNTIRCDAPQPEVIAKKFDGIDYIYICTNERTEETEEGVYYIYDHNEIIGENLPVDEIFADPEKYLEFEPEKPLSRLDRLENLVNALLMG